MIATRRGRISTYSYAQDMVTSSSLYYTPKTAAAEIARPGSEWRWMGVCGWVHGRFVPHRGGFAWNRLALLIIWEGSSMDASNTRCQSSFVGAI